MTDTPEENPHDPWEPGEHIDDVPEFAGDVTDAEKNPPSEDKVYELFSDPNNVQELMDDIAARQRAAALGKAAETRAKEIYSRLEEAQREQSPNRAKPSGEVFNPAIRSWEEMHDDD